MVDIKFTTLHEIKNYCKALLDEIIMITIITTAITQGKQNTPYSNIVEYNSILPLICICFLLVGNETSSRSFDIQVFRLMHLTKLLCCLTNGYSRTYAS